jgi:integrase
VGDEPLEDFTVQGWALEWLKSKEASHAKSTAERYRKPVQDFIAHLGKRADLPLRAATPRDVRSFRDALRKDGRAAATVNFAHKVIASAFEAARRQAFIEANPAHAVDYLPTHPERVEKGTFSPEQVAALTVAAPSDDWRGVILLAYFAGLRLRDCLSLTWGNIDLPNRALSLIPRKTARTGKGLLIPMHPQLEEFFLKHPAGKRDSDPGFPSLYRLSVGGNRGASRTFQNIMAKAGVVGGTLRERAGKSGRKVAERSFHSLRHSYVTALAHANVALELRQKLAGHASEGQSLHYTHPEFAALRNAIEKLPSL